MKYLAGAMVSSLSLSNYPLHRLPSDLSDESIMQQLPTCSAARVPADGGRYTAAEAGRKSEVARGTGSSPSVSQYSTRMFSMTAASY